MYWMLPHEVSRAARCAPPEGWELLWVLADAVAAVGGPPGLGDDAVAQPLEHGAGAGERLALELARGHEHVVYHGDGLRPRGSAETRAHASVVVYIQARCRQCQKVRDGEKQRGVRRRPP